jgi:pimeloyl-ACP methyl ester carboxylesterase
LVKALVLIGPTGYDRLARPRDQERIDQFNLFSGVLGDILFAVITTDNWQEFFLLDAYKDRASLTPEVRAIYDKYLKVPNAEWVIFSFVSGNLDQDVKTLWPTLTQPTLLVWGTLDGNFASADDADSFLAERPDVQLVKIEGARLLPNEDQYEVFNQAVLEFLKELE